MNVRPPRQRLAIESGGPEKYFIRKVEDLADHVLAAGPRYEMTDLKVSIANRLGPHTSGVMSKCLNAIKSTINLIGFLQF